MSMDLLFSKRFLAFALDEEVVLHPPALSLLHSFIRARNFSNGNATSWFSYFEVADVVCCMSRTLPT